MKKLLSLSLFLAGGTVLAQAPEPTTPSAPVDIEMKGEMFCSLYPDSLPKTCMENTGKDVVAEANLTPQNNTTNRKWRLRLYFGNANTFYDPTKMEIHTSRLDLTLDNVYAKQRSGYQYFRVWERPFSHCLKWIDEPTNNLKIVFDKKNHQFFLSVNHPKLVYVNQTSAPDLNNGGNVHVTGTVDGVYHDANLPLNPQFDGYNTQPGELNISKFENSYMFMQYEVGYGYAIPLLQIRRAGSIVFTPQIQAGIYTGPTNSAIMKKGGYWDLDHYEGGKSYVMGYSITPAGRLEWRSPRQGIGIFAEYRRSFGKMEYGFLDGTIKHDFNYHSITLGISTSISRISFRKR